KPTGTGMRDVPPPTQDEVGAVARRLGVDPSAAGASLVREKRCSACHPGLGKDPVPDVPLALGGDDHRGCLSGRSLPSFTVAPRTRKALAAYQAVAAREKHPSPFTTRQMLIEHLGCVRCHQRDSDRQPPLEAIGSTLGGAWLQTVPFQRTPRLT